MSTSPATAAVVVAIAGTILPAILLVFSRSAASMLYMVALKFYNTNRYLDAGTIYQVLSLFSFINYLQNGYIIKILNDGSLPVCTY